MGVNCMHKLSVMCSRAWTKSCMVRELVRWSMWNSSRTWKVAQVSGLLSKAGYHPTHSSWHANLKIQTLGIHRGELSLYECLSHQGQSYWMWRWSWSRGIQCGHDQVVWHVQVCRVSSLPENTCVFLCKAYVSLDRLLQMSIHITWITWRGRCSCWLKQQAAHTRWLWK